MQEFVEAILQGAENYLEKHMLMNCPTDAGMPQPVGEPISFGPDGHVPEEEMMHPDVDEDLNDEQENWSEAEIPKDKRETITRNFPQAVRQAVRRMHRGLGHPSWSTFLKMMKLGGASTKALDDAKSWVCPTCAASAAPHRHLVASTRPRPHGFNTCMAMDLKYLKEADDKNFVASSMLCASIGWHEAVFVKNRKPRHVSNRIFMDWIAHYGVPDEIVVDQGGEFKGYFNDMCEQMGIDTRIVGSGAPWQH